MKIKEGFVLRQLLGENIVVGEGLSQINFNKIISLNASAAYLWQSVEGKTFDADELARLLLEKYDVSEEVAKKDAEALIKTWVEAGIVEE